MAAASVTRHALVETYVNLPPPPPPPSVPPPPPPVSLPPSLPSLPSLPSSTTMPSLPSSTATPRPARQSMVDFVQRTDRSVSRDQIAMTYRRHSQPFPSPSFPSPNNRARRLSDATHCSPRTLDATAKASMVMVSTSPTSIQAPWRQQNPPHLQQRPTSVRPPLRRRPPGELFASLPGEVLELILDELKELHLGRRRTARTNTTCATCWMRDACAMALTARKMLKYARAALYEAIEIVGADVDPDAHAHAKRHRSRSRARSRGRGIASGSGSKTAPETPQPQPRRLVRLLQTLDSSPAIAAIVRSLKVPALGLTAATQVDGAVSLAPSSAAALTSEYETLVAAIVMACPNLERVVGFYPAYDHATHSRYFQALSTRHRLREMNWVIAALPSEAQQRAQQRLLQQQQQQLEDGQQQKRLKRDKREKREMLPLLFRRSRALSVSQIMRPVSQVLPSSSSSPAIQPALLSDGAASVDETPETSETPETFETPAAPETYETNEANEIHKDHKAHEAHEAHDSALTLRHSARFLNHHIHWQHLSTLTVHCQPGGTLAPPGLLVDTLAFLPALQNLYLSHLPAAVFDDAALLALPPLRKLSLVRLPGVSSDGLAAFATRAAGAALTTLALVHVRLDSLPALARMLANLAHLTSFTFVQSPAYPPPALAPDDTLWLMFPYLASASLQTLHWDLPARPAMPALPVLGETAVSGVPGVSAASATPASAAVNADVNAASASPANIDADTVLARSIASGGFPQLRRLRAPADPEGLFQALCRPQERADLPHDRYRKWHGRMQADLAAAASARAAQAALASTAASTTASVPTSGRAHRHSVSASESSSAVSVPASSVAASAAASTSVFSAPLGGGRTRADSTVSLTMSSSAASSSGGTRQAPTGGSNLQDARLAAQARIDASRHAPRFEVRVTDEEGRLVDRFGLGGHVGTVGSSIAYHLLADAGASDDKGGLVDMDDFLGDGGERLDDSDDDSHGGRHTTEVKLSKGCTGQWNTSWVVPQKKDRQRWWHTERGRWSGVRVI